MPRKKKKHHTRRLIRPAKRHRNKILNRDLDEAYNRFCGAKLYNVLEHLQTLAEDCKLAKAYYLALRTEIANRRAKKHKGDMRYKLYQQKVQLLNMLISHCQLHGYRVERATSHDAGPTDVVYCYLPGCEQLSWHCSLGKLPLPVAKDEWDKKKFSTLRKLEQGLLEEFYSNATL